MPSEITLKDIFGVNGILSRELEGYEYRDEQSIMSEAVLNALKNEGDLIIEAGTGIGKSLAYLASLCIWLKERDVPRAIVSTYTKALQKQLYEKELPFIKKNIFPQLRYAVAFGSENYICLKRLTRANQRGLFDIGDHGDMDLLLKWVRESAQGLRSEIDVSSSSWLKVRRESDICMGKKCEYFSECFFQTAKALERKANIIISNHHLYFAHVASGFNVLPLSECVIFDEAHEIEGVASDHLGIEVSTFRLRTLLDSIISTKNRGLLLGLKWIEQELLQDISAIADKVRKKGEEFFNGISAALANERSRRLQGPYGAGYDLLDAVGELSDEIEKLADRSADEDEEKEISAVSLRCLFFKDNLRNLIGNELENYVYWLSQDNRAVRFTATPLKVSDLLKEHVFENINTSVLTSATLSVRGDFSYIKDVLGLPEADTVLLSSPFDFSEQAAIYIPEGIPDPGDPDHAEAVAVEIDNILAHTGGRTLVLFTSYALMDRVSEMINGDHNIIKQGEMDNFALLEEFRTSGSAALFGTYAFWQGIDLQGDILKCVVITKLPFAVPSEPVMEARLDGIRAEGRDPFYEFQVPSAVITFKQGFGRLIRSKTDRGVVAILDPRITGRSYGRYFLGSLPETGIIKDLELAHDLLKSDI
ncbi:MAG: DEAD/DEAH box helicase [Nitrospirota bacterium]|nr:MAG: DEAD/DEAH box helicase [Nitrospirota bacterium]